MNKLISLSEITGRLPWKDGVAEVCAIAEASYGFATRQLVVELDSYVVPIQHEGAEIRVRPTWLPQPSVVRMRVDYGEAKEAARDIFVNHCGHVRVAASRLCMT